MKEGRQLRRSFGDEENASTLCGGLSVWRREVRLKIRTDPNGGLPLQRVSEAIRERLRNVDDRAGSEF